MNDDQTETVLGLTCVTLANLLMFSTGDAKIACYTHLVEMSGAEGHSPFQSAALRSVADAIRAYHSKTYELQQVERSEDPVPHDGPVRLELRLEDPPPDEMRVGETYRLEPIIGESGTVAAYKIIGDDGAVITTVPAAAVGVERS
jgi:hypothetical protein